MSVDYGKILIVDGSYMLHRSLHVKSVFELKTSNGVRVGAVFSFLRSLDLETTKNSGYMPIVVWDAGLAKRRLEINPDYKHHAERQKQRADVDAGLIEPDKDAQEYIEQYVSQRAMVNSFLDILGVPHIRVKGWEGDDIMYTLSKMSHDNILLTDDKDLIQMLSPTTKISRPMHNDTLVYDDYQSTHHDPNMRKFIMTKALVGDGSDNIPGVAKGLGGKAAEQIAQIIYDHPIDWKDVLLEDTQKKGLGAPKVKKWVEKYGADNWSDWADKFVEPEEETGKIKRLPPFLGFLKNYDQFEKNIKMTDLSLVIPEINKEFLDYIAQCIVTGLKTPNYFSFMAKSSQYEFKNLDTQGIIQRMTSTIANYKLANGIK